MNVERICARRISDGAGFQIICGIIGQNFDASNPWFARILGTILIAVIEDGATNRMGKLMECGCLFRFYDEHQAYQHNRPGRDGPGLSSTHVLLRTLHILPTSSAFYTLVI